MSINSDKNQLEKRVKIIVILIPIIWLALFVINITREREMIILDNLPPKPEYAYEGATIIYYNGSLYDRIINWVPTGKVNRKERAWSGIASEFPKSGKIKTNTSIAFYDNDPNESFIIYNYKSWFFDELYYHKRGVELPKVYGENAEIILEKDALEEKSYKVVTLKDELAVEFKTFIRRCLSGSIVGRKEKPTYNGKTSDAYGIEVHFENYPAYNHFAHFWYTTDKIIMNPITKSTDSQYFVLTDEVAQQIIQLINDK